MNTKKSMEWSLTTVGVAVLVLTVIVVVIIIFTGGSQRFAKTINNCQQNGGDCKSINECENTQLNFECPKPQVCCAKNVGFV